MPVCPTVISLRVAEYAPEGLARGALASTHMPTGSITVYYDRLEPIVRAWPRLAPALLSHVFAHEIAHVLQSRKQHSETGILKAFWNREDFLTMLSQRFFFTPSDADEIRAGVANSCRNPRHTE